MDVKVLLIINGVFIIYSKILYHFELATIGNGVVILAVFPISVITLGVIITMLVKQRGKGNAG